MVKIHINKGLASIEKPIHEFIKENYITAIEKLTFHLERVYILGKFNVEQQ